MAERTLTAPVPVEELERWLEDDDDTHHLVCMRCDAGPVIVRTLCGLRMTVDQQAPERSDTSCPDCLLASLPHLRCVRG